MSELSVKANAPFPPSASVNKARSKDHAMMTQIAAGDESALHELLATHGEMLTRLIGRLMAWHPDADDVLQETLVTVWQKAGSYRGGGSLEGWLRRIAVTRCQNHFRKKNLIARNLEKFASYFLLPKSKNGDRVFQQSEATDELNHVLAKLEPPDRTAVVMFYMEELEGKEVAEVLGIKVETLHVRLYRARKKLKSLLLEDRP